MSVLNVESIKITNGKNIDNLPIQVSPKGIIGGGGARDISWELEGST